MSDWWGVRLRKNPTFDYKQYLGDVSEPSRVAARELAAKFEIKSVLDVGCGPAIDRWVDTGIAWHGVDESNIVGDYCHSRGVSIDHAPAHLLPYRAGAFDLVYSRHLWEHLTGFRPALAEACRVASRAVMITFFRPPGLKETLVTDRDGTRYNDYKLNDIRTAFSFHWPNSKMHEVALSVRPILPFGEVILYVDKGAAHVP